MAKMASRLIYQAFTKAELQEVPRKVVGLRIAVVGRSNAGKSSLLNALMKSKNLAHVSNKPGKTKGVLFYLWEEKKVTLVDLPGYGFARVSEKERERWATLIDDYLKCETSLKAILILMDARHGPSDLDIDAIRFLSFRGIPINFIFTKLDTLKNQSELVKRRRAGEEALVKLGFEPAQILWVSSKTRAGLNELERKLSDALA